MSLKLFLTLALLTGSAQVPQTQPEPSARELAANQLLQTSDWPKAIEAFQKLTTSEPNNPRGWFGLHVALHGAGRFNDALAPLTRARDLGYANAAQIQFRFARTYARKGEIGPALDALQAWAQSGGTNLALLQQTDLDAIRGHERFAAITIAIDRALRPCEFDANARAFDFWIGEWDVQQTGAPRAPQGATSRIEKSLDGCLIVEHWEPPAPPAGKSYNTYNKAIKQWEQFWVDARGQVTHYRGTFQADGSLLYEATENGGATLLRMTFFGQGSNQVRQLGQHSTDGGATWQVRYDLTYLRKVPR